MFHELLLQMSEALRDATERSLVVVDEFGKGTELVSRKRCQIILYYICTLSNEHNLLLWHALPTLNQGYIRSRHSFLQIAYIFMSFTKNEVIGISIIPHHWYV